MKKTLFICLLFLAAMPLYGAKAATTASLKQQLMGRIVIAVESNGEAYYLSPKDLQGHFLGHPDDAFKIMKSQGLGISEKDFKRFSANKPPKSLAGMIILRVQSHGEAYYINPLNLEFMYLGSPTTAFRVMKSVSLGISDANLNILLDRIASKETANITYLTSKQAATKYCDGAKMNSAGYRKTITNLVVTNIPKDTLLLSQLAKQTIALATTGKCQAVMEKTDLAIVNGEVQIAPIDAWAGVSITMCSCVPQVEVNLLRIPGITKVTWK